MLQDFVFSVHVSKREKAVDDWNILMTGARMPGRTYANAKPSEICFICNSFKQNKHTFQTTAGFFSVPVNLLKVFPNLQHPHKNVVENI